MWPMLPDYDFIVVRFGGYKMFKTLAEAEANASKKEPDTGIVYQKGFYSKNLERWVGKDKWFAIKD